MERTSARKVSAGEMRALDRRAIEEFGIPSLLLMENAGRGVAEVAEEMVTRHPPHLNPLPLRGRGKGEGGVLIFCGKGNNGGDGLAAARHLANRGYEVQILLFADPEKLKEDPAVNFRMVLKMGIPVTVMDAGAALRDRLLPHSGHAQRPAPVLKKLLQESDIVIDALFGVGLSKNIEEPFLSAVRAINQSGKKVIAVDLPSGLHSDTGAVMGAAVKADITAALALPKKGLYEGEGPRYSGKIHIVDIGIPRQLLK